MSSHVIADPATGPAVPPAGAGWDGLSAALTEEVPVIADRDDLIVTIAPGAGHGAPAAFLPHSAAIEVDGTHLGIDPATARPHKLTDRDRYAATWGALTHECAHAQHSRWEPPTVADPAVVEAAMLLEESRIEGAHLRRRPDDRHWLRASATAFVMADNGGGDATTALAMTAWTAAHNAALLLGRVDAGVLDEAECAPAARTIDDVLGTDTLAQLRDIWRAAHTTGDDDSAAMLELGRRWIELVGPNPHADPEPGSELGAAVGESVARVAAAVAAEKISVPAAPGDDEEARARDDEAHEELIGTVAERVFGGPVIGRTRPPRDDERRAARILARALTAASQRERAVVKTTSALPPGRLRMRGVLTQQAQRAAGQLPTAEPFTRAVRTPVPTPPLRIGIACDISGSMTAFAEPVASAAWIIANAARWTTMPTDTATVTFGTEVRPVTRPGTPPGRVAEFASRDNWEALDEAIDALDGALGLSRRENTRLLVVISDAEIVGKDVRTRAQHRITRLRGTGCGVLWLATRTWRGRFPFTGVTVHPLTDPAATARTIGRAATTAARTA